MATKDNAHGGHTLTPEDARKGGQQSHTGSGSGSKQQTQQEPSSQSSKRQQGQQGDSTDMRHGRTPDEK